jgi:4-oxalocrotonate tautomerase
LRLTVDTGARNDLAAALKLPSWATRTNSAISFKSGMRVRTFLPLQKYFRFFSANQRRPASADSRARRASRLSQEHPMPYVSIRVTKTAITSDQKRALIRGATELLVKVLDKDPATTFVVIDEVETENWGVAGEPVTERRRAAGT